MTNEQFKIMLEASLSAAAEKSGTNIQQAIKSQSLNLDTSQQQLLSQLRGVQSSAQDRSALSALLKTQAQEDVGKSLPARELADTVEQLSKSAKEFLKAFGVGGGMAGAAKQLKEMAGHVAEIDTAMLRLKNNTNETAAAYNQFLNDAADRAKRLGASISDVVSAGADFAGMGFRLEDAATLAEVSILYKNVAEGIDNVADSSAAIIAAMQAFSLQAGDAIGIVDRFNEVGGRFGTTSKGIGDALSGSAASLAAANNTLDQSVALVAAASQTARDPALVGEALNTISLRMMGAREELERFGLSVSGMADSTAALRRELLNLSGVDIMLDGGTIKSTYGIIDELAQKWQDLTKAQQDSITNLLAGSGAGSAFQGLIQNFETARQAAELSAGSMGSAWQSNQVYLDSVQGKLAELSAQFQQLSATAIDDGWIKGIVGGGTQALGVLNNIVKTIGAIPALVGAVAAAMSVKNNTGKTNMPPYPEAA